jgi:choice-of-anchor B domain-containing protein
MHFRVFTGVALCFLVFVDASRGGIIGQAHEAHDDGKSVANSAPAGIDGDGPFSSQNIQLLSQMSVGSLGGGLGNDIWGWTDSSTGKEYALYGRSTGLSFIDISTPTSPIYLGQLPTHTGTSAWRDMKVYQDHVYVVADHNGAHGMQVFDLTNLQGVTSPQTFVETAHYSGFERAHNIAISEQSGYIYAIGTETVSGGLHIVNINSPASPTFAGSFSADGYTHDTQVVTYQGPDASYAGKEIAFNSNVDTLTIVDVTNKATTSQVAKVGYTGWKYGHQGWLTEDHRYFLMNDELDEEKNDHNTRTHIFDVSKLDDPEYLGFHERDQPSRDHNLYVYNGLIYEANYTTGLRVLEPVDLATGELNEIAFFDTYPTDDSVITFDGVWSVYPFFESGSIIVNDRQNGLFVFQVVSEPSSWLLSGLAALGLAVHRRRPRRLAHAS